MRKSVFAAALLVGAGCAGPAMASGDYCQPQWKPENPDLDCVSSIPIAPGNDSRINLFLLLQDRAGHNGAGKAYPDLGWRAYYGRNFLRWNEISAAWYPQPPAPEEDTADDWNGGYGRCQTVGSGKRSFLDALKSVAGIKDDDRELLVTSRERFGELCEDGPGSVKLPSENGYFVNIGVNRIGDTPMGFMAYLEASASFYGGEWGRAKQYYAMLENARLDDWLTETAKYMTARTLLNEAQEQTEDEWGWFELERANKAVAKQAEVAFRGYLGAYPDGLYANSARGLIRKSLWLQRDYARLGEAYAAALAKADPDAEETGRLIEEVDDKLLVRDPAGTTSDALLTAANLLLRMRPEGFDYNSPQLTREQLEAKASVFADQPELWVFLQASHAFYVEKDYNRVRDLLPDDARQESYTPLTFSRQYLRGLALHALDDRNEEGFWRELIGGADGIWQRPAVELALARVLEQKGELAKAFAAGSPIRDARIRRILLGMSAGPGILKAQARAKDAPAGENSFATFTVLWRQLQHQEYKGFLDDLPLAAQYQPGEDYYGMWGLLDEPIAPANVFATGQTKDEFACPALEQTVRTLAAKPEDAGALLCLGDFFRLNGFDDLAFMSRWPEQDLTGEIGTINHYPGKAVPRHDYYTAIMSDPAATRDQQAYAHYRAIRCYAPSGNNSCGGEGVEIETRIAWFKRLKARYAGTKWAKELRYYW
ncbi:hypothetical protein LY632_10780 [Erythrobacter sp. SDW2]|uniref:hypothetical protein n=1 Tax=Erythrobacter sp. SDW2 TaxID=2907154 RepID=UPI001F325A99|nr:hypothetical protein [Erythrobacter sp. SDW2]UIP06172.1 hypothetical protein LY632_10780 [Erythrobacter sp. SDW2]